MYEQIVTLSLHIAGATAHSDASVELYRNVSDGDEKAIKSHIQSSAIGQMDLADDAISRYNATWPGLASLVSDLRTVCPLNALATKMPTSAYFYVATFPISGESFCLITKGASVVCYPLEVL